MRFPPAVALFASAILLTGCRPKDEIRTYEVPKATQPKLEEKTRFLGAIVPIDPEHSYFVRFFGPIEQINAYEKDFDAFLGSIRLEPNGETPILWKIPPGWVLGPKKPLRIVTLIRMEKEVDVELYISESTGGGELSNVNRWRTDFVGIPKIGMGEYLTIMQEVPIGKFTAKRVDFRGPGTNKKAMMPPFAHQ